VSAVLPSGAVDTRAKRPARGTRRAPPPRFLTTHVEPALEDRDGGASPRDPRTEIRTERARTILSTNTSPDVPFERSLNPYRGCEHGCIYCYARPTHAYLDLSPGLDFETKIVAKQNAPEVLERTLRRRGYEPKPIALGANTDPYQPAERTLGITRRVLEVLDAFGHPVTVVTKSTLVLRDRDVLGRLARRDLAHVLVSLTTLDGDLAHRLEPRAAAPRRRLAVLERLAQAGIPVGVLVSPVIPAVNDGEIEALCTAAKQAGARAAGMILLRLPREVAGLFEDWLDTHLPARKERVLSLLRQARGGRLDDPRFGHRMRGGGPYATLLRDRFRTVRRRLGLARDLPPLSTAHFAPPSPSTEASCRQLSLPILGDESL